MQCPNCHEPFVYTPGSILSKARESGYIQQKMTVCLGLYERIFYGNPDVYLNYRLLREAVEHCICDLDRLTTFRGFHNADSHKKAAYTMKWFARIKPVQIVVSKNQQLSSPKYSESVLRANDIYSVLAGFTEMESVKPGRISKEYIANLAYLLHHHPVDADFLSSEMYVLDMYLRGKKV